MAHFAKLDENSVVIDVNCLENKELLDENGVEQEQKGINFLINWSGGYSLWRQTSYNGRIRKNFAALGDTYDATRDAFISPQPYPSWVLNEDTCRWESPVPFPDDGRFYNWDEPTTSWVVTE